MIDNVNMSISDDEIFNKMDTIMSKLKQTQKLQKLSEENGLDVKNAIKFTDDAIDNISVSVLALLIAQQNNDTRYKKLVHLGMEKRSLKTAIINDYKNLANQYLKKYYDFKKSSEESDD